MIMRISIVMAALLLASCSQFRVSNDDRTLPGVPLYQAQPYLLVTDEFDKDRENSIRTYSIVTLPDFSREYYLNGYMAPFGRSTMTINVDSGWRLTSVNGETDQQVDELIEAVAALVPTVFPVTTGRDLTGQQEDDAEPELLDPGLYRIVIGFSQGEPVRLERVTLPQSPLVR